MVLIERLQDNGLFKRISDTALKCSVELAAAKAAAILATVVKDMPLYTLRDERHVLVFRNDQTLADTLTQAAATTTTRFCDHGTL
jgi:hypothetical protein